jgi:hypothetical protein
MTGPNQDDTDDTTVDPQVGMLLAEISSALNDLGGSSPTPDPRIAVAVETLSNVNTNWLTDNPLAVGFAGTLAMQINALLASYPTANRLADAVDCAEQLAGTWSGNDYV